MEDRVIRLQQRTRAESAPPRRKVSRSDLSGWLDRHPPSCINVADSCRYGRHCERIVENRLFDMFADDRDVFRAAVRSGKPRHEALIELRNSLMRLPEVRELLADTSISRRSILTGVHRRAAMAAWQVCFPTPARRPLCGAPDASRCAA
jgi:hypothetical protein